MPNLRRLYALVAVVFAVFCSPAAAVDPPAATAFDANSAVVQTMLNRIKVMSFNIRHWEDFHSFVLGVRTDGGAIHVETVGTLAAANDYSTTRTIGDWYYSIYLNTRAKKVLDEIREQAPDIISFQEAIPKQVRLYALLLGYNFYERARTESADNEYGETNGILWNPTRLSRLTVSAWGRDDIPHQGTFWYSPNPSTPGTKGGDEWGNMTTPRIASWVGLKVNATGKQFYVYNTHLASTGTVEGDSEAKAKRARMKSVNLLGDKIKARTYSNAGYIVTGDFNSTPDSDPIDLMTKGTASYDGRTWNNPSRTEDSYKARHPTSNKGTKCKDGAPDGHRLDYIFTGPSIMILDASIINPAGCPSDHVPIYATVVIN